MKYFVIGVILGLVSVVFAYLFTTLVTGASYLGIVIVLCYGVASHLIGTAFDKIHKGKK